MYKCKFLDVQDELDSFKLHSQLQIWPIVKLTSGPGQPFQTCIRASLAEIEQTNKMRFGLRHESGSGRRLVFYKAG